MMLILVVLLVVVAALNPDGGVISSVLVGLVSGFVGAALIQGALHETAGRKPGIGEFFRVNNFSNVAIYAVLWGVLSGALSELPGVGWLFSLISFVLGILLIFTYHFIIDRNLPWLDGAKASIPVVTGNLGSVILLGLALIGVNIVGALALVVGLLITVPMSYIAMTYAYRTLTQQPVAPK